MADLDLSVKRSMEKVPIVVDDDCEKMNGRANISTVPLHSREKQENTESHKVPLAHLAQATIQDVLCSYSFVDDRRKVEKFSIKEEVEESSSEVIDGAAHMQQNHDDTTEKINTVMDFCKGEGRLRVSNFIKSETDQIKSQMLEGSGVNNTSQCVSQNVVQLYSKLDDPAMIQKHTTVPDKFSGFATIQDKVDCDGKKLHICTVCGKTFGKNYTLTVHMRSHTGEKPYKCTVCGKSFSQSITLSQHRRIHTDDKPYMCVVCGESFNRPGNLEEHKRLHTGDKPFKCIVCGMAFTQKGNLTQHTRIHNNDKPYACTVCGKSFVLRSKLTRHNRIHTGEKPFVCQVCGKAFIQTSDLKKHEQTQHKPS